MPQLEVDLIFVGYTVEGISVEIVQRLVQPAELEKTLSPVEQAIGP
jgi:hypothetical protein